MNCPTKSQGAKCFSCGEHAHIAVKCPKKQDVTKSSCAVTQSKPNKFDKEVLIDGVPIKAMLDSGSDITIMRVDEYVKLGSPQFQNKTISFRVVVTETNTMLREFVANLTIDGNSYSVLI